MDPPPKYFIGYFYRTQVAGLACAHCFTISDDPLLKCTVCRRLAYCGKSCQRKDWKDHKMICANLAKVNARDEKVGHRLLPVSERIPYFLAEQEARARLFCEEAALTYWHPLITHEPKCQVCFRTPFYTNPGKAMTACTKCKLVWWCSPECETAFADHHTEEQCATLCTLLATESVKIAYALSRRTRRGPNIHLELPQDKYVAPSRLGGWDGFYTKMMPYLDSFASQVAASLPSLRASDGASAVKSIRQDGLSIPLTLMAALEKAVPDLATRRELCIHIVGADERESSAQILLEDLLHLLPKLQSLTVILIGPQLEIVPGQDGAGVDNACERCKSHGRERVIIRRHTTYHEFAATAEYRANRPHLVAGFNTGMAEIETDGWVPSIRVILDSKVPAVFTMYSSPEAMADTMFLRGLGAKIMLRAEKNIWRGAVPSPSERYEQAGADHFVNNFLLMVKGR